MIMIIISNMLSGNSTCKSYFNVYPSDQLGVDTGSFPQQALKQIKS